MALAHAIMTALLEDKLSGYELTKSFDTSLGFFWKASHQQIYKSLRDLEQQGLLQSEEIAQQGRPDKVVYQLTEAGRKNLDHWVLGKSQFRESRDDLFVKLYNLGPHNLDHIRQELRERATATEERLALYREIRRRRYAQPEQLSLRYRGVYMALLAGISHCEQYLGWVDECQQILAST